MRICVCGVQYNYGKLSNRKKHYNSNQHTEFVLALPIYN